MLAGENFDGPHVWYNKRTLPRDSRARLAGRARRGGNPICPRRAFLASLALHAPRSVALADCFRILLGTPIEVRDHLDDVGLLRLRQFCIDWNRHHLFGRLF